MLPAPFDADLKVLVLAGSDPAPRTARRHGDTRETPLTNKAFLTLRGRLVVEYPLDLLRACGFSRVWLLAPEEQIARIPPRHRFTPIPQQVGARFFANVLAASAVMAPRANEPVLVVFGDHPLTSASALRAFLSGCARLLDRADFFHALALRESYQAYARWSRRTSVHTRQMIGRATGLSLAIPSRLHGLHRFDHLYSVRKLERVGSFLRLLLNLAGWLGPRAPQAVLDALLLYLAKEAEKLAHRGRIPQLAMAVETWLANRVPVARLEHYAVRVLGADRGVKLIPLRHGGLALDVDFAEEHAALEQYWDAIHELSTGEDAALDAISRMPASNEIRSV